MSSVWSKPCGHRLKTGRVITAELSLLQEEQFLSVCVQKKYCDIFTILVYFYFYLHDSVSLLI